MLLAVLLLSNLAFAQRAEAFIYWANPATDTIGRANLDGTGVDERFVIGSKRKSLARVTEDVAISARHVYWSESYARGGGTIGRTRLDGTRVDRKFIRFRRNTPGQVAVGGNRVYWIASCCRANFAGGAIGRANLNGTDVERQFIPIPFTDGPLGGISVDATHIYWSKGSSLYAPAAIKRTNLDGTGIEHGFITDVRAPLGVAIDAAHIYWTQGYGTPPTNSPPTIARANLDGTGVDQNFIADFTFGVHDPSDVEVDAGHVYWADPGVVAFTGAIGRANLDGTGFDPDFITPKRRPHPIGVAVDGLTDNEITAKVNATE